MADWKTALKDVKKAMLASSTTNASVAKPIRPFLRPQQPPKNAIRTVHPPKSTPQRLSQANANNKTAVSIASPPPKGTNAASCVRKLTSAKNGANGARATELKRPSPYPTVPSPAPVPPELKVRRRAVPIREEYFKNPAAWVAKGSQTQISGINGMKPGIDVVIGLDFGTSYTKAAVGLMDRIYPVRWHGISNAPNEYLLASEYTALPDGSAVIGQFPGVAPEYVKQDLKIPFVNPAVSTMSIASACVFLALVLRYIRAWVFEYHGTKIGNTPVRWQLNLGAPSNGLEDSRLEHAYCRLGNCAWILSQRPLQASSHDAVDVVRQWTEGSRPETLNDFAVLPEFVAQIAGYVQSPQRIPGLHALVDVGGGTMDVVTFIVHRIDDEDAFPFLVPSIKWLGTQMLNQNRLVEAPAVDDAHLPDELLPVMDAKSFAATSGIPEAHIVRRDSLMSAAASAVVASVFGTTKARRYRLSDAWEKGLRTFLTGGGAAAPGYSEAIYKGGLTKARRIDLMSLPMHPRLSDFAGSISDYQRISVACGLAQDSFSLGKIIPAKDVGDDKPSILPVADRLDRDEIYAR